jgi:hypothetical protein
MQHSVQKILESICVYNFSLEYLCIIYHTSYLEVRGVIFIVDHRFYREQLYICNENDRKRSIVVSAEIVN